MVVNKVRDGIVGFVVGDAMGVPNEYKSRSCLKKDLVTEMRGFGTHPVPAGSFSDDSSMMLATIDSLINKSRIDYTDIADNYVSWIKEAKYTPFNYVFDVDSTSLNAIKTYNEENISPIKCGITGSAENGPLMRILPIAYYAYYKQLTDTEILKIVRDFTYMTHRSELCTLGCYIYVRFVICLLGGKSKEKCYSVIQKIDYSPFNSKAVYAYNRILFNDISTYKLSDISSSFYIVDTLESILWCFMKSENYLEAVVAAINLGDDTDTIGALTGALAGIKYGYASIPKGWLDKLLKLDYITDLSNKFELVLKEKNLYKQLNLNL